MDAHGNLLIDGAVIEHGTHIISFPAETNISDSTIEVLVATPAGRTHESLFVTDLDPFKLNLALILAGRRNGAMLADSPVPQGDLFDVMVRLADGRELKADSWLFNVSADKMKADDGYVFVGSSFVNNRSIASEQGNLININSSDTDTILNALLSQDDVYSEYRSLGELVPPKGTRVTLHLVPRGSRDTSSGNALSASRQLKKITEEEIEAIRRQFDAVKFSGSSVFSDYDKLVPVLSVRIPANDTTVAAEILQRKRKLADEFLEIYHDQYVMEQYIRISEVRSHLKLLAPVFNEK